MAEYNGVWVFAEQRSGELQKVSLEILGEGRRLANELGVKLTAVLLGNNVGDLADTLGEHGADEVLVAEHPELDKYTTDGYTKVICDLVNERKPGILFIGATFIGRDLGPRVAARLSTGLTADCTHLDINMNKYFEFLKATSTADTDSIEKKLGMDDKTLKMTRPAFGGNVMATIRCADYRPQMATVRPGVMKKIAPQTGKQGTVEEFKVEFTDADMNVTIKEVIKQTHKAVDRNRIS